MHAFTFSSRSSWLLLAALSAIAAARATPSSPSLTPRVELTVPEDQLTSPPALGTTCEHWALDFSLRAAMQTCSMWADLELNEHWLFSVRATIANHRMVDMFITEIDHDCDACFDWQAEGRTERARYTVRAVEACMREQLASATFEDDSCELDTRWAIQSDW